MDYAELMGVASDSSGLRAGDLRRVAAITAVVVATVAVAGLAYLLLDILLLLFVGIVVAAALQPWHVRLSGWGVPRGPAVLLIYLILFVGIGLIGLVVGPLLVEQMGAFAADVPAIYGRVRSYLQASGAGPLRALGVGLPPFARLAQSLPAAAPQFYEGAVGVTTSIIALPAYFVTVLAIGFYWTMEVPRFERLVLSMIAVERRARALNIWHEIEAKLGGFMRGQGLAMLCIGAASAVGYALIGLPNVLALAVLAGLLEAVPMIGPVLAVVPAILVALPMGLTTVLLVIGLAVLLQVFENNIIIPRIMHHAVGVSALVGLLSVLAFGTLYGILGVLIAIPMTAVIQVLFESMVVNAEPSAEPQGLAGNPWHALQARVGALRQHARGRLRARSTRMGIDPEKPDHVVDAVDQQIEVAVARIEQVIALAQSDAAPLAADERAAMLAQLNDATEAMEQTLDGVAPTFDEAAAPNGSHDAAGENPDAAAREAMAVAEREAAVAELDRAAQRFMEAVQDVEATVVAVRAEADTAQLSVVPPARAGQVS